MVAVKRKKILKRFSPNGGKEYTYAILQISYKTFNTHLMSNHKKYGTLQKDSKKTQFQNALNRSSECQCNLKQHSNKPY